MAGKHVTAEAKMGAGFKTECTVGAHTVVVDQPQALGGTDGGPTPLDYQLVALAGCLCALGRIIAMQRRLELRGMSVQLEAKLDTDALLGKQTDSRTGFQSIKAKVQIDADLSDEEKEGLLHEIDQRCPISDNLTNATELNITLG